MIEYAYGFFPGGDPRKFRPDVECCTPEEIEAHRLACERAATLETERDLPCPSGWECDFEINGKVRSLVHITRAPFGIGTYEYDEPCPPPVRLTRPHEGAHVVESKGGRWVAFVAGMAFRCRSKAEARKLEHYGDKSTVRRWSRRWR